jgi:hypothetical protein
VKAAPEPQNRFNGFPLAGKSLKRLTHPNTFTTRLKPGGDKSNDVVPHFYEYQ